MSEQSKSLFRFQFDEESGTIERIKIDDYVECRQINGQLYYKHKLLGVYHYCYLRDLDRYKSKRLYSFDPDYEHAREIIKECIQIKRIKVHEEYLKFTKIINKLNGWGTE